MPACVTPHCQSAVKKKASRKNGNDNNPLHPFDLPSDDDVDVVVARLLVKYGGHGIGCSPFIGAVSMIEVNEGGTRVFSING